MKWHKINLPAEYGISSLKVEGKKLCLIYEEAKLQVTSSKCPHAGADLSQGWCENGKLVCPYHRHQFDVETGKGDPGQGNYIKTYPTKFENGSWYVGISSPWWKMF